MDDVLVERHFYPSSLVARLVSTIISIIEFLLALRIVLELLGANSASPFVAWVYDTTGSLVGPFSNAFPSIALGNGALIDLSALFAMVGYAILGWLIMKLFWFVASAV